MISQRTLFFMRALIVGHASIEIFIICVFQWYHQWCNLWFSVDDLFEVVQCSITALPQPCILFHQMNIRLHHVFDEPLQIVMRFPP